MRSRVTSAAVLLISAFILAGCLTSKSPLFGPSTASTPLPAGRYAFQVRTGAEWKTFSASEIALSGKTYLIKSKNTTEETDDTRAAKEIKEFTLHSIGPDYFAAMARLTNPKNGSYLYFILQKTPDGSMIIPPSCDGIFKLRDFSKYRVDKFQDHECLYSQKEQLVQDLLRYAEESARWQRLVPCTPQVCR